MLEGFTVEEATFAGIRLLGHDHLNTNDLGFVGKHLDEAGMGQEDKRLVIPLAEGYLLLPAIVLPNHEGADAPLNKAIHNTTASRVQLAVHLAFALISKTIQTVRGVPPFGEQSLVPGTLFVVVLVQRLEWTPVDQKGREARLV